MDETGFEDAVGPPQKRLKRMGISPDVPPDVQPTRKGKACTNCRKMKVKCDLAERGTSSCSRCLRLGHHCVNKMMWTSTSNLNSDETAKQTNPMLFKLERALEDILEKLNMPALELYAQSPNVEPVSSPRSTRHNSHEPEPVGDKRRERNVSPGPMQSLIEATRLDGLCSQLRSVKQRRRGGMRRMDSDLISEKILSYEQAERLFDLFKSLLSPHLFSATIPSEANLETVRTSSTVLFTAIMLVSAVHIPGYEQIHRICHARFLGLLSSAIFDRFHTLDDIRGLCIAAFWQPDLSWTLSGICIRMATELNLHHAFYEVFHTPSTGSNEHARQENLEKTRLWYLLFVLDHQSSIAYGRPPVMAELRPIKDVQVLLNSSWCTPQDRALIAHVTGFVILSKAFETFGLEPKRTMGGDDASVLTHNRFTEDARIWKERWRHLSVQESPPSEYDVVSDGKVDSHYYFSELVLHSLVLRGRSLDNLHDLPSSLRPLTLRAIEAAHSLLQHFVDEPGYREGIVGMPLYFHSMIAFATVFLMKLSHRWHVIGITIDPAQRTRPLIKATIELLRGCKAGASHMVFSMANGFEQMLSQARRQARPQFAQIATPSTMEGPHWAETADSPDTTRNRRRWTDLQQPRVDSRNLSALAYTNTIGSQQPFAPRAPLSDASYTCHVPATPDMSSYQNWGFQDEELWNLGMGYDLLAPGDGLSFYS